MSPYLLDWLSLVFRWLHILAAIAWVGSSLKYVWIDNNLRKPPQWKADKGIKGDVWVIHGGGIYEFQKYQVAPDKMPDVLHWVKWESYTTWLSGFLLISVVYYSQAATYLMPSDGVFTSPGLAVLGGVSFLALTLGIYEVLIRTPLVKKGPVFAVTMTGVLLALSYLAFYLFSPRAAALHIGAAIGTIMSGNVFFGIVPAQKAFVKAIAAGEPPPEHRASFAKLRSTHNNYFTLPVIMLMISNHYPVVYSHTWGWLIIIAVGVISAYARHFFNLKNQGVIKPHILVVVALASVIVIGLAQVSNRPLAVSNGADGTPAGAITDLEALSIVQRHCANCHADAPIQPGFSAPPAGVVLTSKAQVLAHKQQIYSVSVQTQYMPLGNFTGITEQERAQLGAWLNQY